MQKLWQDLRCGARGLFKRPGFSFIAVITFSLGIGATAAIFSVNNAGGLSKAVAAGAPADQPQNQKAPASAGDFEIQKLSEGVYAVDSQTACHCCSFDPNNVFIINDDDVIVVDANASSGRDQRITGGAAQVDQQAGEIRHQHALARRSHSSATRFGARPSPASNSSATQCALKVSARSTGAANRTGDAGRRHPGLCGAVARSGRARTKASLARLSLKKSASTIVGDVRLAGTAR